MRTLALDIETDALDAKRIWVICAQDIETEDRMQFLNVDTQLNERRRFIDTLRDYDRFVLHNGIGFDIPVVNKIIGDNTIDPEKVLDTLIVSRLIDFTLDGKGHSLRAWGQRLGEFKIGFNDFSMLTQEMIDYCHQDVEVTVKLYKKFKSVIDDPEWQDAIRVEHDIQILCEQMKADGFLFKEDKAEEMLGEILTRMDELNQGFQVDFPPKLEVVNTINYRRKADGSLYSNVVKAHEKYERTEVDWSVTPAQLLCYDYIAFNPASPKQRIDRLWEAGWTPYEKTKGHLEYDRDKQRQNKRRYSRR